MVNVISREATATNGYSPIRGYRTDPRFIEIERLRRQGDRALQFIKSVPAKYRNVQPDENSNLDSQQASEFAKVIWNGLCVLGSLEDKIQLSQCRSLRDYLLWLWALVPLEALWAQIEVWCWHGVVPLWWRGDAILLVLAISCTPESRMEMGPLVVEYMRNTNPNWCMDGLNVTTRDQLEALAGGLDVEHGTFLETKLVLPTPQQSFAKDNICTQFYKQYTPFPPPQPLEDLQLLERYEHAVKFRRSVRKAWRFAPLTHGLSPADKLAAFVFAITDKLALDPGINEHLQLIYKLQACGSLDDVVACLWDLVSPAEIMAKYWYWCHPLELPNDMLDMLLLGQLYDDGVNMPFWNQCHGYLLRVAKANTLQQAQAEGNVAIPLLKKLDPNWATPRGPELLVHDVCQMIPHVMLFSNDYI